MINIERRKNKVFFAPQFGTADFYFYTFTGRERPAWGKPGGRCKQTHRRAMFSVRGETAHKNLFLTRRDGICRPFLLSCRALSLPLQ
jgi:hypothetical protein